MLGALEAILGQRSAHSLATGPVTVEPVLVKGRQTYWLQLARLVLIPFISPLLFTITPALSVIRRQRVRSEEGGDFKTSLPTFKIENGTILSAVWFPLPHNHSW